MSRSTVKGDGKAKRPVVGAVGNTLLVFGERLSVDGAISVGEGGCVAAVADVSGITCVVCDENIATD